MYFLEGAPEFGNQYTEDRILKSYLKRKIPKEILSRIEPDLIKLGDRVGNELYKLGFQAEIETPVHVACDSTGKRIDKIEVSEAWTKLSETAVEEKLVATAYERNEGIYSRIHQMVRIYLYGASTAIYTCPLAMSDGACRAIEVYAKELMPSLKKLISTDKKNFWTSGQWMTEKTGGSDVGLTTTIAKKENGQYRLYGNKFFTSAITSDMAMTLARIEGAPEGGRGLSLFYVEIRDANGNLNKIKINKLKDKMGTKALPTAELDLDGTPAQLVGEEGNGIKKISTLFNITRIWNACIAACYMRRGLVLSKDFAKKRFAFGKYLIDQTLHVETLANLQIEHEAAFLLVMRVSELLGKEEMAQATKEESLTLRLLTPLAKLYTAKQAIAVSSEIIESFGGAGYMVDTGIPRLLTDSQVLSIWEGTTNVLSLDMLRAIQKDGALTPFIADLMSILSNAKHVELKELTVEVKKQVEGIIEFMKKASSQSEDNLQGLAREFAFNLASTYMAGLLIEQADWSLQNENDKHSLLVAKRWCENKLGKFKPFGSKHLDESKLILKD